MPRQLIAGISPYEPIFGYSRAVRVGDAVFVAGTAAIGPDGKTIGVGDAYAQTRATFETIAKALEQAGATLADVVRTRVYLTNMDDLDGVGRAHGEIFGTIRPASAVLGVNKLAQPDWLVEIEVDAVVGSAAS